MADQTIYVEGLGFIAIKPGQSPKDAIVEAQSKQQHGQLGLSNPLNQEQRVGVDLPPLSETDATAMLKAIPQAGGFIAQTMIPAGKAGYAASVGVPMGIEMLRQLASGEDANVGEAALQGVMGGTARVGGNLLRAAGRGGMNTVRKALNIRAPFQNRVAEQVLPELAVAEKAKMTIPGVDDLASRSVTIDPSTGIKTTDKAMKALSEVLERARMDNSLSPNKRSGGVFSMIRDMIDPPKELAIGSAAAQPFGVNTEKAIAPSVETAIRALMALVSTQMAKPETKRRQP